MDNLQTFGEQSIAPKESTDQQHDCDNTKHDTLQPPLAAIATCEHGEPTTVEEQLPKPSISSPEGDGNTGTKPIPKYNDRTTDSSGVPYPDLQVTLDSAEEQPQTPELVPSQIIFESAANRVSPRPISTARVPVREWTELLDAGASQPSAKASSVTLGRISSSWPAHSWASSLSRDGFPGQISAETSPRQRRTQVADESDALGNASTVGTPPAQNLDSHVQLPHHPGKDGSTARFEESDGSGTSSPRSELPPRRRQYQAYASEYDEEVEIGPPSVSGESARDKEAKGTRNTVKTESSAESHPHEAAMGQSELNWKENNKNESLSSLVSTRSSSSAMSNGRRIFHSAAKESNSDPPVTYRRPTGPSLDLHHLFMLRPDLLNANPFQPRWRNPFFQDQLISQLNDFDAVRRDRITPHWGRTERLLHHGNNSLSRSPHAHISSNVPYGHLTSSPPYGPRPNSNRRVCTPLPRKHVSTHITTSPPPLPLSPGPPGLSYYGHPFTPATVEHLPTPSIGMRLPGYHGRSTSSPGLHYPAETLRNMEQSRSMSTPRSIAHERDYRLPLKPGTSGQTIGAVDSMFLPRPTDMSEPLIYRESEAQSSNMFVSVAMQEIPRVKRTHDKPDDHGMERAWREDVLTIDDGSATTELLVIHALGHHADGDGNSKITLVCPPTKPKSTDSTSDIVQLRWLHVHRDSLSFDLLQSLVYDCPYITDELRSVTLKLLIDGCPKFEKSSENGTFLVEGSVVRFVGTYPSKITKEVGPVIFLSSPYISLGRRTHQTASQAKHNTRSLFQFLYNYSTQDRDSNQVVSKISGQSAEVLHIPEIWCLLIGSGVVITCGHEPLSGMLGQNITIDRRGVDSITIRVQDTDSQHYYIIAESDCSFADFMKGVANKARAKYVGVLDFQLFDSEKVLLTAAKWVKLVSDRNAKKELSFFLQPKFAMPALDLGGQPERRSGSLNGSLLSGSRRSLLETNYRSRSRSRTRSSSSSFHKAGSRNESESGSLQMCSLRDDISSNYAWRGRENWTAGKAYFSTDSTSGKVYFSTDSTSGHELRAALQNGDVKGKGRERMELVVSEEWAESTPLEDACGKYEYDSDESSKKPVVTPPLHTYSKSVQKNGVLDQTERASQSPPSGKQAIESTGHVARTTSPPTADASPELDASPSTTAHPSQNLSRQPSPQKRFTSLAPAQAPLTTSAELRESPSTSRSHSSLPKRNVTRSPADQGDDGARYMPGYSTPGPYGWTMDGNGTTDSYSRYDQPAHSGLDPRAGRHGFKLDHIQDRDADYRSRFDGGQSSDNFGDTGDTVRDMLFEGADFMRNPSIDSRAELDERLERQAHLSKKLSERGIIVRDVATLVDGPDVFELDLSDSEQYDKELTKYESDSNPSEDEYEEGYSLNSTPLPGSDLYSPGRSWSSNPAEFQVQRRVIDLLADGTRSPKGRGRRGTRFSGSTDLSTDEESDGFVSTTRPISSRSQSNSRNDNFREPVAYGRGLPPGVSRHPGANQAQKPWPYIRSKERSGVRFAIIDEIVQPRPGSDTASTTKSDVGDEKDDDSAEELEVESNADGISQTMPFFTWNFDDGKSSIDVEKTHKRLYRVLCEVNKAVSEDGVAGKLYTWGFNCDLSEVEQRHGKKAAPQTDTGDTVGTNACTPTAAAKGVDFEGSGGGSPRSDFVSASNTAEGQGPIVTDTSTSHKSPSILSSGSGRGEEGNDHAVVARVERKVHRVLELSKDIMGLYIPFEIEPQHFVLKRYWGALDCIFRQIHFALCNSAAHVQQQWIVKEFAHHSFDEASLATSCMVFSSCETCSHEHVYPTASAAIRHIHEAHAACSRASKAENPFEDPCYAFIKATHRVGTQLENLADMERLMDDFAVRLRKIRERARNLQLLVRSGGSAEAQRRDTNRPMLPRRIVEAFQAIVLLYVVTAKQMSMGNEALLNRRQGRVAKPALVQPVVESGARAFECAMTALDRAKQELMIHGTTASNAASISLEAIGPEFLMAVLTSDLQKRKLTLPGVAARIGSGSGGGVVELYRDYTAQLQFEGNRQPQRRVFLNINALQEELEALRKVVAAQLSVWGKFSRTLDQRWLAQTSSARVALYRVEEPYIAERIGALVSVDGELATLQSRAAGLREEVKQSIEILEEGHGKAIRVFTLVTLFFSPLSFVSSFFGMNTMDVREMEYGQTIFWAAALPVTTIVIALAFVYGYRWDEIGDYAHARLEETWRRKRGMWTASMRRGSSRLGGVVD